MKKVWVFKFDTGDEEDLVLFKSKPSREQMDEVLLEYLDQVFIDNKTTPAQERARENDKDFTYLYYEDLWEKDVLNGSDEKKSLEEKLADLYEWTENSHPDVASVISMAEETLRKSK